EDAAHYGKPPSGSDHDPTRAFRLGFLQQDAGNYAVSQQNQDQGPHEFSNKWRRHAVSPLTAVARASLPAAPRAGTPALLKVNPSNQTIELRPSSICDSALRASRFPLRAPRSCPPPTLP